MPGSARRSAVGERAHLLWVARVWLSQARQIEGERRQAHAWEEASAAGAQPQSFRRRCCPRAPNVHHWPAPREREQGHRYFVLPSGFSRRSDHLAPFIAPGKEYLVASEIQI